MERVSRGRQRFAISVALGFIAAAVAWLLVSASSRAEDVDLTTADLVPQDVSLYIALNTDLDSSEWISAFSLVEKLGREDAEAELRRTMEEEGEVDWDEDIAPFLGGNAAVYLRSYDWSGDAPDEFGIIIRARDPERAMKVVLEQLEAPGDPETFDHDGQAFSHFVPKDDEPGYIATIGDHLVLTTTEAEMRRVIDVAHGKEPSLSDSADFQALRDELTRHFLAFVYVDAGRLMESLVPGELMSGDLGTLTWTGETGIAAFVVGAKDSGFVFQSATGAIPEAYAGMFEPRESRFLDLVPVETAVFLSAHDVGEAAALALESMEQQFGSFDDSFFDDPNMTEEERQALQEAFGEDDPFSDVGGYFGQAADVARLLTGEVAVGIWFPDSGEPTGLVMAEIEDEAAVRDKFEMFLDADGFSFNSVTTEDYQGVMLTVVRYEYGEPVAFGIRDGVLYAGTLDAVRTVLDGVDSSLAQSPRFQRSRDELGTSLASFAFIDLHALFATGDLDEIAGLDRATETLQAVLVTYVQERGMARMAGIVTIED